MNAEKIWEDIHMVPDDEFLKTREKFLETKMKSFNYGDNFTDYTGRQYIVTLKTHNYNKY